MTAVLLENPHTCADAIFADAGIAVRRFRGALDEDELITHLADARIVGLRSKTTITRRVIEACPGLEAIGAYCIGTNQIDLEAATEAGIAVFNAPYSNTRSVVELAIAEIISLTRRLPLKNRALHSGLWEKDATGAHEVRGRTLGIVGYGNIGAQLSVLAEAMGMNVIFYDVAEKLALGNATPMGSLEELLAQADVVSLHVDGQSHNAGMFGRKRFAQMKPGAIFLNLSRGFVTDVDALVENLKSGHISGAGVDVFPSEPKANGDPFSSPLIGLDNVILSPHVGGSTEEAQSDIGQFVSRKIVSYMTTASTDMSVNLPNLTLPVAHEMEHRVALLHLNTPGVLARLNQIFASHGANIDSQILGTGGQIGYAITDISSQLSADAVGAIEALPETVRLRVLDA